MRIIAALRRDLGVGVTLVGTSLHPFSIDFLHAITLQSHRIFFLAYSQWTQEQKGARPKSAHHDA